MISSNYFKFYRISHLFKVFHEAANVCPLSMSRVLKIIDVRNVVHVHKKSIKELSGMILFFILKSEQIVICLNKNDEIVGNGSSFSFYQLSIETTIIDY